MSSNEGGIAAVADGILAAYQDGMYSSDAALDLLADEVVAVELSDPEGIEHARGILHHLASEDIADDEGFPEDLTAMVSSRAASATDRARKRAGR